MYKSLLAVMTVFLGIGSFIQPAYAAHGSPNNKQQTPPVGNDISYPQCNKSYPNNQAFGIVGVNDGLANTTNPCMNSELIWANKSVGGLNQALVQLYVNTANPGGLTGISDWPKTNSDPSGFTTNNPYGICDGSNTTSCSWQYGWNRAYDDVQIRFIPAAQTANLNATPSSYPWWLDVETTNSWESNTLLNTADLEGMVAYFHSVNVTVGIYSTTSQWSQIVGSVDSASSLANLNNWLPGARTLSTAQSNCSLPALTIYGKVTITQYTSKTTDYDNSCI